jgi:uncharacterized heparinase superfamily protein
MNPWQRGGRYWRTLRHLKPRQLAFKLLEAATDRLEPPLSPLLHGLLARGTSAWQPSAMRDLVDWHAALTDATTAARQVADFRRGEFTAAGQTARVLDVATGRVDWAPPHTSPLYRYHLHYGHDLLAVALSARAQPSLELAEMVRDRLLSWVHDVRIGDPAGWRPYPISVRLTTWPCTLALLDELGVLTAADRALFSANLLAQLRYLRLHMEYAVDGNHLLRDLVGLSVGSVFLSDSKGLNQALRVLPVVMREQWLPDGGYFERCPGYHAAALADLSEALRVSAEPLRSQLATTVERAGHWLSAVLHPDGTLPRFGDTTLEALPEPRRLLQALAVPPAQDGVHWLADSGLLVTRKLRDHLVFDLGPLGVEHQPGHAHADIGAFEWSVAGERLIIDTGVPGYEGHPARQYARSAMAHNVAVANGRDHAELWAAFRVGWRPTVERRVEVSGDHWRAHLQWRDDFRPPTLQMHRRLSWSDGCLQVEDDAAGANSLVVRLTLHPLANVARQTEGWLLRRHRGALLLQVDEGEVCVNRAPVWQRMGEEEQTTCVEIRGVARLRWRLQRVGS